MRTLYRLADRGVFRKEDLPWKGKRKPNGHSEKEENKPFAEIYVKELNSILIFIQSSDT